MAIPGANVRCRKQHFPDDSLNTDAELAAFARSILIPVQDNNVGDRDRSGNRRTCQNACAWVAKGNVTEAYTRREGNVARHIVHVVSLDTLVHEAVSAAQY